MAFYSYTLPSAGTFSAYISSLAVIIGNVFCAIFVFFIDLVGMLLGAMRGALIGRETGSGIVRGAVVGAISGGVIAIEVFESLVELWKAYESGIGCLLCLIDVTVSLLTGRFVRERFRTEVLSELQDLMGDGETGVDELSSIQVGGFKGLSEYSIDKIPKFTITN